MHLLIYSGAKEDGGDETRSRSSVDIANHEGERDGDPESSQVSRSKKMWNSFKTRAKKMRSRSREKVKGKGKEENRLSQSQPDISNNSESPGTTPKDQVFDQLFDKAEKRQEEEEAASNEEKKVEEDSGIAETVSTTFNLISISLSSV